MAAPARERLLAAATMLLVRDPAHLTLEAVAREAGTSKGGLLYHFASKADLLDAVVDDWEAAFEARVEEAADEGPGGLVRGYAKAAVATARDETSTQTSSGLLAVVALHRDRLQTVRRRYVRWQRRIADDGIDPVDATIVRLAADGLWLADVLDLAPPSAALRAQVMARLRELASARD